MFQPRVILHPTDSSDCSRYAFHVAVDLARQHQAALLIVNVVETLGPENITYGVASSELEPAGYRRRLARELCQKVPAPPGLAVEHILAEGDPAHEIERVARERSCDLIILGTHGRTGLSRLLMGSVAEQVVRLAPCPVLITKPSPNKAAQPT